MGRPVTGAHEKVADHGNEEVNGAEQGSSCVLWGTVLDLKIKLRSLMKGNNVGGHGTGFRGTAMSKLAQKWPVLTKNPDLHCNDSTLSAVFGAKRQVFHSFP